MDDFFEYLAVIHHTIIYRISIVIIHLVIYMLMGYAGNSLGLLAGYGIKNIKVLMGYVPTVVLFVAVFSGFFKNQRTLLPWISWVGYLSPFKYAFEAATRNQYTGLKITVKYKN